MQKVKLKEIIGKAISGEWGTDDIDGTGVPVLRTANFTNNGVISYKNVILRNLGAKVCSEKFLHHGDIIIEKSGGSDKQPVGRVVYFDGENNKYLFNNFTALLRVKNQDKWLSKYIFYCLFHSYTKGNTLKFQNKTTGLHNLQLDNYLNSLSVLEIPYDKQTWIVKNIDKVTDLIEKRKKQIEKLDELVRSRFIEMFGDCDLSMQQSDWKKISSVAEIVGGSTPKTDNDEFWGGENCWITPAEINSDSFILYDTERKLTKEGVKSCSLRLLPVGTVLLSSRAPIGKLAIAGTKMYCNQGFKNIICSATLNSVYTFYLLKCNSDYLVSLGRGATFKEISKEIVGNIFIPVPPIELQNKFAEFVEKVEKTKSVIKKSLSALETLKKSLMQKYFG